MNENEHIRHEVANRLRSFVGLYKWDYKRELDIALDWSQERIDADFTDPNVIIDADFTDPNVIIDADFTDPNVITDADFTNTDFIAQRSFNKSKAYKAMVANLSVFLTNDIYENNLQLYKLCYEVIWQCAKNLSYPEFYQAFHIQAENT